MMDLLHIHFAVEEKEDESKVEDQDKAEDVEYEAISDDDLEDLIGNVEEEDHDKGEDKQRKLFYQ